MLPTQYEEIPLIYPVTTEYPVDDPRYSKPIADFYEASGNTLAHGLPVEKTWWCYALANPFFFGSFMHLWRSSPAFSLRCHTRRLRHVRRMDQLSRSITWAMTRSP